MKLNSYNGPLELSYPILYYDNEERQQLRSTKMRLELGNYQI